MRKTKLVRWKLFWYCATPCEYKEYFPLAYAPSFRSQSNLKDIFLNNTHSLYLKRNLYWITNYALSSSCSYKCYRNAYNCNQWAQEVLYWKLRGKTFASSIAATTSVQFFFNYMNSLCYPYNVWNLGKIHEWRACILSEKMNLVPFLKNAVNSII